MKEVRTVIWDCDNLMWFHKPEEPQITAKALGIAELEEFSIEFYKFFESFMEYFKNKKVNMKETLRLVERNMPILDIYGISPEKFMTAHEELKIEVNDFNYDTLILMKYLREKNIRSVVKSDWWRNVQEGIMNYYGVMDYIEELHCCDNAYLKCNPLSAECIVKPGKEEQYIVIGDSLRSDIVFANHAGIKSIWFNHDGKNTNQTPYNPTFEVNSLVDIIGIL